MAIYSTNNIPFIFENLENNDILVYDSSSGVFINKKLNLNNYDFISSAKNAVNTNSISVFKEKDNEGNLIFKSLLEGHGINITDTGDELIISTTNSAGFFTSSDDFTIVINDIGNNNNSKLILKTGSYLSAITIPVNVLAPVVINDLYTGNTSANGFIKSSSFNFLSYGFQSDMIISLEGSIDQDGIYIIDSVVSHSSGSTIFFKDKFTGIAAFNLGGPKFPTTIKQASIWVPDNDGSLGPEYDNSKLYSVQFWNINIGVSGYNLQEDMIIKISGTENGIIDGYYRIKKVFVSGNNPILNWPAIVFHHTTPLPEDLTPGVIFDNNLFSNEIELEIHSFIKNTGFHVDTEGNINATRVFVSSINTLNPNELTSKFYVDNKIDLKINEFNNVVVSSIANNLNNLESKVDKINTKVKKTYLYYLINSKY